MRIIINADDLGYSQAVNEAVFGLMQARRVSSATLLVSGPCFENAVQRLSAFPWCSFGVHLNVTEFHPAGSAEELRKVGLLDETGKFNPGVRSMAPTPALKEAIFHEWCAQIQKALECSVPCSHLDSHHHVHTVPWLFNTFRQVLKKYRLRGARRSLNWYYYPECKPSLLLLGKKKVWNMALRYWCGAKTTDHFTSFAWFFRMMSEGFPRRRGVAELMTHPGQPHAREETDLLWSNWQARIPFPIELVSYNEL